MDYHQSTRKQRWKDWTKTALVALSPLALIILFSFVFGLVLGLNPLESASQIVLAFLSRMKFSRAFDVATFFFSLVTFSYLVVYHIAYWGLVTRARRRESFLVSTLNPCELEKVWHTGTRESSMITMGSLFVPTSFALLGLAGQANISCAAKLALSISAPIKRVTSRLRLVSVFFGLVTIRLVC